MSTRGFLAFAVDGEIKTAYNHSDSYPDGLGIDVLSWLRSADFDLPAATTAARALRAVDVDDEPTDDDIARLAPYADVSVGTRSERPDWYQLLRRTQGDPGAMLAAGVIKDASGFPADSLFAEWGYVVDFDARVFEVYEGFQHSPHKSGRFADLPPRGNGYYPVRLVASWPLSELPGFADFVAACEKSGEAA